MYEPICLMLPFDSDEERRRKEETRMIRVGSGLFDNDATDAANSQPSSFSNDQREEEGRIRGRGAAMTHSSATSGTRTKEEPEIEPGPNDVLSGRTRLSYHHPGNKRFREIISNSVQNFSQTRSRGERAMIVSTIFDTISTRGGRFLKKPDGAVAGDDTPWYVMTEHQAKEKIAHAVRDATANSFEVKKSQANLYGGTGGQDKNTGARGFNQELKEDTVSPVTSQSRRVTSAAAAFEQSPTAGNASSIFSPAMFGLGGANSIDRIASIQPLQAQYNMSQASRMNRSSSSGLQSMTGNRSVMPSWSTAGSNPGSPLYSRPPTQAFPNQLGPYDTTGSMPGINFGLESMQSHRQDPSQHLLEPIMLHHQETVAGSMVAGGNIGDLSTANEPEDAIFNGSQENAIRALPFTSHLQHSSSSTTDSSFFETINDALGPVHDSEEEIDRTHRGSRGPTSRPRPKLKRKRPRDEM